MTVELSRLVSRTKIGPGGLAMLVRATPEECAAVAARMSVPAIHALDCFFNLTREDDGVSVFAEGRLQAKVARECIVSAEEFDTTVEDEFVIRFVPSGEEQDDANPDLPDEVPYEGDTIDIGEAAVEQLGLALDPYPRIEGASLPEFDDDAESSPFSPLARRSPPDGRTH